jgi:diguanylate cyclase (GGDEF)-like protein/PAS domain S-box-containing protein
MAALSGIVLLALAIIVLRLVFPPTGKIDAIAMISVTGFALMILIIALSSHFALRAYRRMEERQLQLHALYESSRATEAQLGRSEQHLRLVTDNLPVVIGYIDQNEVITFANRTYESMFGVPHEKIPGSKVKEVLGETAYALSLPYIRAALNGEASSFERPRKLNGKQRFDAVTYIPEKQDGKVNGFFLLVEDITERKQAEEERMLTSLVYDNTSEGMMILETDGAIVNVNPAFSGITGYTLDDVYGRHLSDLAANRHPPEFFQEIRRSIGKSGHWQGEIWNRYKDGEPYLISIKFNTVYGADGKAFRRIALFSDITEKKASEEKIWKEANFDPLTGLPNRRMFHERLRQEMLKADRSSGPMALVFIDLDHFKEVNDTLGHALGDVLLKETAVRLSSSVRGSDTVARLGGDEFTVILGNLPEAGEVARIAEDILSRLAEPFFLGDNEAHISASIGITLYPDDGTTLDMLMKNADQAMYAAKERGRNRYNYFAPFMQQATHVRKLLAKELRQAVELDQLRVLYQPIVELRGGAIHKAEALLRWEHPDRGMLSPKDFLSIAEATGIIVPIGEWVFQQAIHQVKRLQSLAGPTFQVCVNKSALQFRDNGKHFRFWTEALAALDLPSNSIIVEVSEHLLHDAGKQVSDKLHAFRNAGVEVSLDDYGTGHSSLSFMQSMNIDYLKINPDFIARLGNSPADASLCEAIIVMAHKLGMKVIAEGVETEQQRTLLLLAGCDYGQGFLLARPMLATELEVLLLTRKVACG